MNRRPNTSETHLMNRRPNFSQTLVLGIAAFVSAQPAVAGVKLITLPVRERVEIQLDNMNVTLVEEERVVPLARGENDVVFAWANTNIDTSSIQFRCLTDPDAIKVLSVSYPPGENALTWQVFAPEAVSARVRISYVIGQAIELNLGRDPEVVHERIRLRTWRDNFWFQGRRPKLYFSPTKGHRIEPSYSIAGWDEHERWVERVRNYRVLPIQVEIRRSYEGHVIFASDPGATLYDYRSPQFTATIAPSQSRDLSYDLSFRQGINKTQDNVTLE